MSYGRYGPLNWESTSGGRGQVSVLPISSYLGMRHSTGSTEAT